jgi:pimeloyl-ACP methyl ester carboxylesterase
MEKSFKNRYLIEIVTIVTIIIILFTLMPASYSQRLKPGPQDLSFFSKVDETDQPYAIYIPKNFDENKKYPLVVFLHGAWSNHRLGLRRAFGQGNNQGSNFNKPGYMVKENDLEASRYFPVLKDVDYIVAAPYARGTAGYQGIPEQDVYEMLDDIKSRLPVDENRIYLTGLSMGGGGSLWLGLTRPDIWAAIAPVCPAPPTETAELYLNASNLPVHLFIGTKDGLYKTALEWKSRLLNTAKPFDFTEYPGVDHNSWEYAYKDGYIFEWFSQFTRNLFPSEVNFSTRWYKYNKAYWVCFDNLTPGTLASINAKFTSENRIEVTTNDLNAFTLNLSGHESFNPVNAIEIIVDGIHFSLKGPDAFSFLKNNGKWVNEKYTPGLNSKRPGAEGPVYSAVSSNHVYVYGTADKPPEQELAHRRASAETAANWLGIGGRIMVFPRAISDKDVRESDYEHSNLVLFGTAKTNAIIQKYAEKLPMELSSGENEYGLLYIYPANGHYLLINSGLEWWTPSGKNQGQQGITFMRSGVESLGDLGDFVLFKGSLDNIIVQGNFDNNWKLPESSRSDMKKTGVVDLK